MTKTKTKTKTLARQTLPAMLLAALTLPVPLAAAAPDPKPDPTKGCEKVTCPAQNGEFALHLPNPDDCGSFCKCDWGVVHYFACPPGLHFNSEQQVCDFPANAGCE